MHPIERLRYVARSSGASQVVLVRETAAALAALGFDPPGLVTACRRILDRHPLSGPLWWLSARVLTSNDPTAEAWNAADEITADDTCGVLAYALPDDSVICVLGWPDVMGEPWELDDELVPIDLVDRIAMPDGVFEVADALKRTDCPIAPELFKSVDPL